MLNEALVSIPSATSRAQLVTTEGSAVEAIGNIVKDMSNQLNQGFVTQMRSITSGREQSAVSTRNIITEQDVKDHTTACVTLEIVHALANSRWDELSNAENDGISSFFESTIKTLNDTNNERLPAITNIPDYHALDRPCCNLIKESEETYDTPEMCQSV